MVSFGHAKRGAFLKRLQSNVTHKCNDGSISFLVPENSRIAGSFRERKQNPWNPPDRSKYLL